MRLILAAVLALALPAHAEDRFRLSASSAKSVELSEEAGEGTMQSLHLEWARMLTPRWEASVILAPHFIEQPSESVRAASLSILVRRRFFAGRAANLYAELATGPFWSDRPFPANTGQFNFMSQLGAGVILMPRSRMPLFAGYRELHISNFGSAPRNPGIDMGSLVFGVQFTR